MVYKAYTRHRTARYTSQPCACTPSAESRSTPVQEDTETCVRVERDPLSFGSLSNQVFLVRILPPSRPEGKDFPPVRASSVFAGPSSGPAAPPLGGANHKTTSPARRQSPPPPPRERAGRPTSLKVTDSLLLYTSKNVLCLRRAF